MVLTAIIYVPATARAQSGELAVSSDLLLQGRPSEGLLVLRSGYRNSPLLDAEALVFIGATDNHLAGDVLAVSVGVREPHGYGQARIGRFILAKGAVRPVQIDGVSALGRVADSSLEVFAGLPVVPDFGPRAFDWLLGGRVAQQLQDQRAVLGVSYLQRRDAGQIAAEELGADVSVQPFDWLAVNAIAAWDLVTEGLAEARVGAIAHQDRSQLELFASRRIAARLLPATSLFSVISDAASSKAEADGAWRIFPRLELGSTLALDELSDELGYRAALRSTLFFSDADGGEINVEVLRRHLASEGLTGGALRIACPFLPSWRAHLAVELVAADRPAQRGALWPWARVGTSYAVSTHWMVAAALGVKGSPEYQSDLYALVRIAYQAEVQP
jgi:hypothetical protein